MEDLKMSAVYDTHVVLKLKPNVENDLVKEIKNYIQERTSMAQECKDYILDAKNIKEIVERVFCGKPLEECSADWEDDNEFMGGFNASYGWYDVMLDVKNIMVKKEYSNGTKVHIDLWD